MARTLPYVQYITKSPKTQTSLIFQSSKQHIHDSQLIFYPTSPRTNSQTIVSAQTSGGQKRAICNFSLERITQYCHNSMSYFLYKSSSFYTAHCSVLMVWVYFYLTFDSSFTTRLSAICHFVHYCARAIVLFNVHHDHSQHPSVISPWQWVLRLSMDSKRASMAILR